MHFAEQFAQGSKARIRERVGTVAGAVIEIFAGAYISTQLQNAIVFAVLIVVLLVKPAGLMGKMVQEKV